MFLAHVSSGGGDSDSIWTAHDVATNGTKRRAVVLSFN